MMSGWRLVHEKSFQNKKTKTKSAISSSPCLSSVFWLYSLGSDFCLFICLFISLRWLADESLSSSSRLIQSRKKGNYVSVQNTSFVQSEADFYFTSMNNVRKPTIHPSINPSSHSSFHRPSIYPPIYPSIHSVTKGRSHSVGGAFESLGENSNPPANQPRNPAPPVSPLCVTSQGAQIFSRINIIRAPPLHKKYLNPKGKFPLQK